MGIDCQHNMVAATVVVTLGPDSKGMSHLHEITIHHCCRCGYTAQQMLEEENRKLKEKLKHIDDMESEYHSR